MKKFWLVAIFMIFSDIKPVQTECSGVNHHCDHVCLSTGKYMYNCPTHSHLDNHGCECLPKDYCDHRYNCNPTDVVCSHNEAIRCNENNTCECYCSQDSQCHNCPAETLGFCVNEKCVCETNNYCPGGNELYCLRNYQCAHSESKRCNQNDRCECFCIMDTDCKNCPEKGFCVDWGCVCESQDYCPKGNFMYCISLSCDRGYTSKCNSTNHCYCAYVPDTCSNHDVSKCYHLTCSSGEKKYCEGRTCTCKPLDYCHQNDADCQHNTCDASKAEINVCLSGTCGCLAVPDFCGGDDTSTCQHIICNQYQVKKCENGMCKCQVNPSCDATEGLDDTCTPENTYLEVKGPDGQSYYVNCTDSFHYPLCVEDRCQCVYWKTPPPLLTAEGSTIPTSSMTEVAGSTVSSTVTEAMTDSSTPIPTDQPTGVSQTNQTTASVPNTTEAPPTISVATCASRLDCNQQNTYLTFPTFTMPCPIDHIDCVDNECFCSLDKITTSRAAGTTTQKVSTSTASSTSVGSTASATNTTPLSTSHPPLTTSSTAQTVSTYTASSTSVGSTASTTNTRLTCPVCDENQSCNVTQACSLGEVCMIRNTPFTVHCSKKQDCIFMKTLVNEIICCEDHQCISKIVPDMYAPLSTSHPPLTTTTTATTITTTAPLSTSHLPLTTTTTTGLKCPVCETIFHCVWNRVCHHGEVCMIINNPFSINCSMKQDCHHQRVEKLCCEDEHCVSDIVGV